jgi:phage protein D/phage baseplate assembly protein gpV
MNDRLTLKIDSIYDPELSSNILEVVVDTNVFMPGMFMVVLEDQVDPATGILKYTDSLKIKIGATVQVIMGVDDPAMNFLPKVNSLIKGEITAIEPIFDVSGRVLLRIRGYDLAHRLTYGKKTRAYGDANPNGPGITETQIVQNIVRETGGLATAKVDASGLTSMRYTYVMQYNQSDWDFLWARAQLFGYQVYADGNVLNFVKADAVRSIIPPSNLVWGQNLKKFEPRMIALGQVTETAAYGWDSGTKKSVTSAGKVDMSNTSAKNVGAGITGSQSIKSAFLISAEDIVIEPMVRTVGQAKTIAGARFEKNQSQFVRASGELVLGDPFLVAGTRVKISGVGVKFAGSYYVTEARHIWNRDGYTVKFQVSGRNPYSIRHLLQGKEPGLNRINGVVVAKVTNLLDPERLGRVQVTYPWMPTKNGAEHSSNWARLAVSGGGKNRGIFFTPEVDDEVLVAFEHGDPSFHYIVGALWNKMDKPPTGMGEILAGGGKEVNQRVVRSRSGHTIIFDDTKGEEQIIIRDKTEKNSIVINSKDNSMMIKTEGDFTIEAGGKFTVKSKRDFSLASQAKGAIEAKSTMEVKGQSATVKAGSSELGLKPTGAELKGMKVDVQANTQASIKGSAMVEIQGALVKIN